MIKYRETKSIPSSKLELLFQSVGFTKNSANYPKSLKRAIKNSDYVITAWSGKTLIGLMSGIDDTMHAYGVYLLVLPEFQNSGIGSMLLKYFDFHYNNYIIRLNTSTAKEFYEKNGYNYDSKSFKMVKNNITFRDK